MEDGDEMEEGKGEDPLLDRHTALPPRQRSIGGTKKNVDRENMFQVEKMSEDEKVTCCGDIMHVSRWSSARVDHV